MRVGHLLTQVSQRPGGIESTALGLGIVTRSSPFALPMEALRYGAPDGRTGHGRIGSISSDAELVCTDDFGAAGAAEFDLTGRAWLRVDFGAGQPAFRADLRIGCRGEPARPRVCVDLSSRTPGEVAGYLRRGASIFYHMWRDRQGDGVAPMGAAEAGELATSGGAVLVSRPAGIPTTQPEYAPDWPRFPLPWIDFALDAGWYGCQVNAVDLFGRFSRKSEFAEWRQWYPTPVPGPWYYLDPPGDRQVHPTSVRLRDVEPPPTPAAVEAWLLDPADPRLAAPSPRGSTAWASRSGATIGLSTRTPWCCRAEATRETRPCFSTFHGRFTSLKRMERIHARE